MPDFPAALIVVQHLDPRHRRLLADRKGVVHLNQAQLAHLVRPPADLLFESVAASFKERGIGGGAERHGNRRRMGPRAIKKMGGTLVVQLGAEFKGMPTAARARGGVDLALPLEEIGLAVNRLVSPAAED